MLATGSSVAAGLQLVVARVACTLLCAAVVNGRGEESDCGVRKGACTRRCCVRPLGCAGSAFGNAVETQRQLCAG